MRRLVFELIRPYCGWLVIVFIAPRTWGEGAFEAIPATGARRNRWTMAQYRGFQD
jgi:hypothetical protein